MDSEPTKIRVRKENLPRYALAIAQWVHPPLRLDTIEKIEIYAIKATRTRSKNGSGKSIPWWTPESKAAYAEYRNASLPPQRVGCAKTLRATINDAKKEYLTRTIYQGLKSGNANLRFSYADDFGILEFGSSISESAVTAQREVDHLLEWARDNAVAFDTEKSEVVQFPGRRRETAVLARVNDNLIEPAEHICWLGVHLDPRLNFQHHVTQQCANAMKVAQHMRRFNSAYGEAASLPLVRAMDTCIVPVATFRSDDSLPGVRVACRQRGAGQGG
ncbi:hypothetical protein K3495_g1251 [Podosphaera aphanis]|nr:hypothetical protein K3495_g1251 [Podosphaera aphanis]